MMEQNRRDSEENILRRRDFDRRLLHEMILLVSILLLAAALLYAIDLGIRFWSREAVLLLGLILNLLVALKGVITGKQRLTAASLFVCVCIILTQIYILL
ncbi:MAG: hypothetical protein K6C06_04930 [Lachnospiraceae bacterium]|nr:hypothetical protein [Lachnospiraceae bacterium]